ncbi:hypothetical protein ACHAPU_009693 [Fusarium lateritium]
MANKKPETAKESADEATRKQVAELKEKLAHLYKKSDKLDEGLAESQVLLEKVTFRHKQIQKYGSAVPYHQHHHYHLNPHHGSSSNAPSMSTIYISNHAHLASHLGNTFSGSLHGGNATTALPPWETFDVASYFPN